MSSEIHTSPGNHSANRHNTPRSRKVSKRQPLSCLLCRHHKLRCDRKIPCGTCIRYHREDLCHQNPAPRATGRSQVPITPPAARDPISRQGSSNSRNLPVWDQENQSLLEQEQSQIIGNLFLTAAAKEIDCRVTRNSDAFANLVNSNTFSQVSVQGQTNHGHNSIWALLDLPNQKTFWMDQLTKTLPTRTQCDILLAYHVEHINWIFQTVHIPTFRKEYADFWNTEVKNADAIWMSLLLSIISLSALYIPFDTIELVGIPRSSIRKLAHTWHLASQQALQVGQYESKPCLLQLQTFSITQLYWYATNNIELLNSRLGQAIRHAQAMNLDKDESASSCLIDEMRHRIWWDLVDADTFQSICLDRAPLVRVQYSNVPVPLNCNDMDITETSVTPRPLDEPTEMSMHIFRARVFQLLNKRLSVADGKYLKAYDNVQALDQELLEIMEDLPWYFQQNAPNLPAGYEFIKWQHHILRTCVSTQRIRMYKPFLSSRVGESWRNCAKAAEDALSVYRELRVETSPSYRQKFFAQAYQIFSVAVTIAALLLVEQSEPFPNALECLENMATDLQQVEKQGCPVPVALHGRNALLKMLWLYEQRRLCTPREAENLVSDISIILGGEQPTRAYLDRHTAEQAPEPNSSIHIQPASTHEEDLILMQMDKPSAEIIVQEELDPIVDPNIYSQEFQSDIALDLLSWDMTGLFSEVITDLG